jgi:hypothetical protein
MTMTVVRYETKPERADENAALVEKVFVELAADRPEGLQYMTLRLADGVSFVHIASVTTSDRTNPLFGTAAFAEFQKEVAERCATGPVATGATVVGAYGFELGDA